MSHARQQVVAKVQELINASADVQAIPLYSSERMRTPIILVGWQTDDVENVRVMGAPLTQGHTLALAVAIRVKGTAPEDELEDLSAVIEALLSAPNLAGVATEGWRLRSTTRDLDNAGEQPVLQNVLLYEARYKTRANDPTVII